MYHHISENLNLSLKNMQVPPAEFEQQMHFLHQHGFHCLDLCELIENEQQGTFRPGRSFVLTFDDGYIDNYKNAASILKEYGFFATVFVVVNPIENENKDYLSWHDMRELSPHPFTFGSHTLTHPSLVTLEDARVEHEMVESKKIIEDRLGQPVDLLAYPYGVSNERVRDLARKSGYKAACGVTLGYSSQFNVWRVPVNKHENDLMFNWKAIGGYHVYTWCLTQTLVGRKMRALKRYVKGASL